MSSHCPALHIILVFRTCIYVLLQAAFSAASRMPCNHHAQIERRATYVILGE